MQKRLIVNHQLLEIMVMRLCHQLIENHGDFSDSVIIGLQPRGRQVAQRIQSTLKAILGTTVPTGYLDTTFHRDDFRRRDAPLAANATHIDFLIEGKKVILADDVLYTGRSVRAAMDAMISFGRPANVELLVLIDRLYSRHLPIEPTYVGRRVNSLQSQRVLVEWQGSDTQEDNIWLVTKNEE
ncbi:bifunctional pyr operon transcriptional regulator/uracil phosphoribosyltransferase PyrR [Pontibacter sp. HSC-14F20]|uniref:bifunctional pyr operon transcriptional regulator/uracil phosphoribosyltransferase PyrR n=1 Tax=unclassified Pontibacter TaxID=2648980 RepID=UPI001C739B77|nr:MULTISPECIES: bifunctional pyr operon transcriptional regulator/uracil phosphoribosyltransferase PyrR [unclassified Pontibacter]MBX0335204.1 bifunctional pyr operon transcriptional regulator/uracil phosphoribosyltransferase PyrR [Pontibacter sp. HSC-14F20]MCP2042302.1 pyrimidine operon attenuation protein/uracil phosphoribosyltransferase [Pontibacter sp. HSC-36F09]